MRQGGLTIAEAARLVGVTQEQVAEWIEQDRIPFVRTAPQRDYLIPSTSLLFALPDLFDLPGVLRDLEQAARAAGIDEKTAVEMMGGEWDEREAAQD